MTSYTISFSVLQARLTLYIYEITGDNQCEYDVVYQFIDQSFCTYHILQKEMGIQWHST